jgi:exopolysaccharide biosynthesis polyprenyl glycosylphosphotransferase
MMCIERVIGLTLYLFLYFYYANPPRSALPRRGVASYVIAVAVLTLSWRWVYIRTFTAPQFLRRVLLVGGGNSGRIILKTINALKVKPFDLVGIIDDNHRKLGTFIEGYQVIGTSEQLIKIISANEISEVIVAIMGEMQGCMFQVLLDAQEAGVEITRMPIAYEEILGRIPIRWLEADWILRTFADQTRVSVFFEITKRLVDIAGALLGLTILIILFPVISLVITIADGWPIFYSQTRSGRGGQVYNIFKFRTMKKDAEADGVPRWANKDDSRATRTGRILRKTHIDELPQFFNVLRGEMSLVGPRAERPEMVALYQKQIPFYRARLLVKPGITGWAQVNFGYASSVEETMVKLEYDLYYIKHRSIFMEILILLRTPATMLGFRGR